jgi:hypothetical protein
MVPWERRIGWTLIGLGVLDGMIYLLIKAVSALV